MIRLLALWAAFVGVTILLLIVREDRLVRQGKVPLGRLRRLWGGGDRRTAPRFWVNWPIHYRRVGVSEIYPAKSRDLSQTGAGLIVHERLEIGCRILLELDPPIHPNPLKVTGRVVWSKEILPNKKQVNPVRLFFVGVKFDPMNPEVEADLSKALRKKG